MVDVSSVFECSGLAEAVGYKCTKLIAENACKGDRFLVSITEVSFLPLSSAKSFSYSLGVLFNLLH